ncbi:MAG TPA: hypothetical protein VNP03_10865, partial [Pseudonocardia sp.]|nr:hypothetical protein [Pseudonocardia sp.]
MRTTHGMTGPSNGAPTPSNQGPAELRNAVRDALAREQLAEATPASGHRTAHTGAAPHSGAPLGHRLGSGSGRGRSGAPRDQQPNRCQALRRRGG